MRSLRPGVALAPLVDELAPAFGGDLAAAREILEQTFDVLTRDSRPDPWGCYLAEHGGRAVGTCAFKSAPDAQGSVEIAYMTFPAFEGCGHACAMAAALLGVAHTAGARLAVAHTLPEEGASTRVLARNGFVFAGEAQDPEDGLVWRWEKRLI